MARSPKEFFEHARKVVGRCEFPGWTLEVRLNGDHAVDGGYLTVGDPNGVCNVTGQPLPWRGRKWRLSIHMTDGEIVQTAFLAIMTALEHEARESFKFLGVAVMEPHRDIYAVVEAMKNGTIGIKERDPVVVDNPPTPRGVYHGLKRPPAVIEAGGFGHGWVSTKPAEVST